MPKFTENTTRAPTINCGSTFSISKNSRFLLDLKLILLTVKIMFVPESTEGFTQKRSEQIAEEAKTKEK